MFLHSILNHEFDVRVATKIITLSLKPLQIKAYGFGMDILVCQEVTMIWIFCIIIFLLLISCRVSSLIWNLWSMGMNTFNTICSLMASIYVSQFLCRQFKNRKGKASSLFNVHCIVIASIHLLYLFCPLCTLSMFCMCAGVARSHKLHNIINWRCANFTHSFINVVCKVWSFQKC